MQGALDTYLALSPFFVHLAAYLRISFISLASFVLSVRPHPHTHHTRPTPHPLVVTSYDSTQERIGGNHRDRYTLEYRNHKCISIQDSPAIVVCLSLTTQTAKTMDMDDKPDFSHRHRAPMTPCADQPTTEKPKTPTTDVDALESLERAIMLDNTMAPRPWRRHRPQNPAGGANTILSVLRRSSRGREVFSLRDLTDR